MFANRSRLRPLLPSPPVVAEREHEPEGEALPTASGSAEEEADVDGMASPNRRRSLRWTQLLLRVFFVDALSCPRCTPARGRRVPMVVLALITDPRVLRRILSHLELPADRPPLAPCSPGGDLGPLFEHRMLIRVTRQQLRGLQLLSPRNERLQQVLVPRQQPLLVAARVG